RFPGVPDPSQRAVLDREAGPVGALVVHQPVPVLPDELGGGAEAKGRARRPSPPSVKAPPAPRPPAMPIGADQYSTGNSVPSRRTNQSSSWTVCPVVRGSNIEN